MSVEQTMSAAVTLHRAGQLHQAEQLYRHILSTDPNRADALHYLGLIAHQSGDHKAAWEFMRRAIEIDPSAVVYYANAGPVLQALGRAEEAVQVCRRAVSLRPDSAAAYNNLASALRQQGAASQVIDAARRALSLVPNSAEAHANLAWGLRETGDLDQAIASYHRSLELKNDAAQVWFNLGLAYALKASPRQAMDCYLRAVALHPSYREALNNLGVSLAELNRTDEAIECYRRALELEPNGETYNNLGTALKDSGRLDEALAAYRRAQSLNPDPPDVRFNIGFTRLLAGDLPGGWADFEARWQRNTHIGPRYPDHPRWDGSDLNGRRILLHAEQGFGDTIQFVRYAPMVAARGGRVILRCQPPLKRLMAQLAGIEQLVTNDDPLPAFDTYCPLLSLPAIFQTTLDTIPATAPYIRADPQMTSKWKKRLAAEPAGLKVGLAWAGNPIFMHDRARSPHLANLAALGNVERVRFYSLQKGLGAEELRAGPPLLPVTDWTDELADFADTSALIDALDLVVTSDTAVPHLAGAMGKKTFLLLTFAPDWRWMLWRSDSPWYPTMRLFRQPRPGDWQTPVDEIAREMRVLTV